MGAHFPQMKGVCLCRAWGLTPLVGPAGCPVDGKRGAGGGKITMGNNVTINYGCIMHGLGGITIGSSVMLSPHVHIYAQNHGIKKGVPIRNQPQTGEGVSIGSDVWIGAGVVILDGVRIGDGAVIGANAVVTKNIPENEIWGGSPTRKIGVRQ